MRRILEVVAAIGLVVSAVVCWNLGVVDTTFDAVADGTPEFVSTRYCGSWIGAATVCVVIAGLLVVDAVRITIEQRSHTP